MPSKAPSSERMTALAKALGQQVPERPGAVWSTPLQRLLYVEDACRAYVKALDDVRALPPDGLDDADEDGDRRGARVDELRGDMDDQIRFLRTFLNDHFLPSGEQKR